MLYLHFRAQLCVLRPPACCSQEGCDAVSAHGPVQVSCHRHGHITIFTIIIIITVPTISPFHTEWGGLSS